jgi:F0F1-type ATP synthase beta subunit
MNRKYTYHIKFLLAGIMLCIGLMAKSQDSTLSVISNVEGAPAELKFSELKSILMGEKQRWRNGTKISIAMVKTNKPIGKATCKKIYNMSGDEVNKFWLALVFQGKAQAPLFFNTTQELQNYVAQNQGAIGILNQAVKTEEIKTVLIGGKERF